MKDVSHLALIRDCSRLSSAAGDGARRPSSPAALVATRRCRPDPSWRVPQSYLGEWCWTNWSRTHGFALTEFDNATGTLQDTVHVFAKVLALVFVHRTFDEEHALSRHVLLVDPLSKQYSGLRPRLAEPVFSAALVPGLLSYSAVLVVGSRDPVKEIITVGPYVFRTSVSVPCSQSAVMLAVLILAHASKLSGVVVLKPFPVPEPMSAFAAFNDATVFGGAFIAPVAHDVACRVPITGEAPDQGTNLLAKRFQSAGGHGF